MVSIIWRVYQTDGKWSCHNAFQFSDTTVCSKTQTTEDFRNEKTNLAGGPKKWSGPNTLDPPPAAIRRQGAGQYPRFQAKIMVTG